MKTENEKSAAIRQECSRSSLDSLQIFESDSIPAAFFQNAAAMGEAVLFRKRRGKTVETFTWKEIESRIRHLGASLIRHGLEPGDCVALMADNGPLWVVADLAVQTAGGVLVPVYSTSTGEQIRHIVNDCSARFFLAGTGKFLSRAGLDDLPDGSRPAAVLLEGQVSGEPGAEALDTFLGDPPAAEEIDSLGRRTGSLARDDICSIIYTSGTSGPPKGVMLSHGNILEDIKGCRLYFDIDGNDVFLSLLPMSHSFERTAGYYAAVLSRGSIHFARSTATFAKDIVEASPTKAMVVPRLLEKLRQKIVAGIESAPGPAGALGRAALGIRLRLAKKVIEGRKPSLLLRGAASLAGRLIVPPVRKKFGGRLELLLSGGAPLSTEVWALFHALGIKVMEGYGLTESSPVIACPSPDRIRPGSVGKPIPTVEVKIAQDGEILARGPCIMKGYHGLPEATSEAIDREGYLHTGDIGHIDSDGFLFITDRKKDIIVSASGKNIAPQNVECTLCLDPLVEFACVFGDKEKFLVAVLSPDLEAMAEQDLDRDAGNAATTARFQQAVDRANETLAPYERVFRFHVAATPFTEEGGEITTSHKVKRRVVLERYAAEIEKMFRPE